MDKNICFTKERVDRGVMSDWTSVLKVNPIPELLEFNEIGLINRVKRDLLSTQQDCPSEPVCEAITYKAIARRQKPDGSWRESGSKKNEEVWTFITTLRSLYLLLDLGSSINDEIFEHGVQYLIGTQTKEGDFRGAYGATIPAPDYTGMVLDVFLRGGFDDDHIINNAFDWLLSIRRNKGGWAIPVLRSNSKKDPSSHNVTGMTLRGFASDPKKQHEDVAKIAATFLAESFFKPDDYPDRRRAEYWGKLAYPFWFTDILSAMDVLSRLGFGLEFGRIERAYQWLLKQQQQNGFWINELHKREKTPDPWLTYAALKTIKSFNE
ncbi:terpene cyclase/mutase family protein [bacterium]|nr:terpene cyclase/mutase family protein [bacterium]